MNFKEVPEVQEVQETTEVKEIQGMQEEQEVTLANKIVTKFYIVNTW